MASRVDTELSDLDQASQRTAEVTDDLRQRNATVMASLTTLEANFEGAAAEALIQYREVASTQFNIITDRLSEIAEALKATREQYEETDSSNASNISGEGTLADLLRGATNDVAGATNVLHDGHGDGTIATAAEFTGDRTGGSSNEPLKSEDAPSDDLSNHEAVLDGEERAENFFSYNGEEPAFGGRKNRGQWAAGNLVDAGLLYSSIQPDVDRVGAEWVGPDGRGWQLEDGSAHPDHEGKSNAFRHALLMASVTSAGIDYDSAIDLGVAHELDGDTVGEGWGSHDSYSDLVNNQAGAEIGLRYPGLTAEELAPIIAEVVENGGENPLGTDLDLSSPKG